MGLKTPIFTQFAAKGHFVDIIFVPNFTKKIKEIWNVETEIQWHP